MYLVVYNQYILDFVTIISYTHVDVNTSIEKRFAVTV
jgi:hypothetical protein